MEVVWKQNLKTARKPATVSETKPEDADSGAGEREGAASAAYQSGEALQGEFTVRDRSYQSGEAQL
jgi:hypothetical protein